MSDKPGNAPATSMIGTQPEGGSANLASERDSLQQPSLNRQATLVLGAYKTMLISLFSFTFLVVVILLVIIFFLVPMFSKNQETAYEPAVFLVVILSGVLGSFFSSLIRLYNIEELPKALVVEELSGLKNITLAVYSIVPAFIGGISAAIVYLAFAGEIIKGALFPQFSCNHSTTEKCYSFSSLIYYWGPDEARDFAKAIIWGFIAGFVERFAPDALGALAKSARKTD